MRVVFKDVEIENELRNVVVEDGKICEITPSNTALGGDEVIDGAGGSLLPGLHDHHIHLAATVYAKKSIDCAQFAGDTPGLINALRASSGSWVRAINYDEKYAGELNRRVLDEWIPDRPIRILHRSGALWILNSLGLQEIAGGIDSANPDIEFDEDGLPNGRLWRSDSIIRNALPQSEVDFTDLGAELCGYGITGVTEASPELDSQTVQMLSHAREAGLLPQKLVLLGVEEAIDLPGMTAGPRKLVLPDHDLPNLASLVAQISRWHQKRRPVALHVVSAEALVLGLTALEQVGVLAGDRIEHGAVIPKGLESWLAKLGVIVVTQPGFILNRGDHYLADLPASEHEFLYRYATLQSAGVEVVGSSDSPYGPIDPWVVIESATLRRTAAGEIVGELERVSAAVALNSYLKNPLNLNAPPRRIHVGAPADLCLLQVKLGEALANPSSSLVRMTAIQAGEHTKLFPIGS